MLPDQENSPRVLVATTVHWVSTTRFALALAHSGCAVAVIAPPDHELNGKREIAARYVFDPAAGGMAEALARAIAAWSPGMVIPCDDPAAEALHALHSDALRHAGPQSWRLIALIENSLGPVSSFSFARRKSDFIALAEAEGITVPETARVRDLGELRDRLKGMSWPVVLKVEGSWGGLGVRVVGSRDEAERAFSEFVTLPSWPETATRAIRRRGIAPLRERLRNRMLRDQLDGRAPLISLQRYIDGRPANRALVCWQGEVLAGISVEALETCNDTGPATIARVIDHREMARVAAHLVARLRLSGFYGFDFMLEEGTGRTFLLEMNARPTQTSHLALGNGAGQIGALYAKLAGTLLRRTIHQRSPMVITFHQSKYPRASILEGYGDEPRRRWIRRLTGRRLLEPALDVSSPLTSLVSLDES